MATLPGGILSSTKLDTKFNIGANSFEFEPQ